MFLSFLAAVLTGGLYVLSFPPSDLGWLAWFAFVPLIWALRKSTSGPSFLLGWIAGVVGKMGSLYWIAVAARNSQITALHSYTDLFLLSSFLALYWGGWAFIVHHLPGKVRGFSIVAASLWVLSEYGMSHLLSGFPWGLVGASQWRSIPLIQMTSVTGIFGLSFIIVSFSAAMTQLLITHQNNTFERRARSEFIGIVSFLFLIVIGGYLRIDHVDKRKEVGIPIRVAALQLNVLQHKKFDPAFDAEVYATLSRLGQRAADASSNFVIYPETSIPLAIHENDFRLPRYFNGVTHATHAWSLMGASRSEGNHFFNSAFLVAPDGNAASIYTKHRLIPYAEHIPALPWLNRIIQASSKLGRYWPGTGPSEMDSPFGRFSISICYEAIFPEYIRNSIQQGSLFIVNISNDGLYRGTAGIAQHFALATFRAVENGRWMVRADNIGVTALIDPLGRAHERLPPETEDLLTGILYASAEETLYTRFGDWLVVVCGILALFGLFQILMPPGLLRRERCPGEASRVST